MYKYVRIIEQEQINYNKEVLYQPHKPNWPKEWEWNFDFSDIILYIKLEIKFFILTFFVNFLRKNGIIHYPFETTFSQKEISVTELEEYLLSAIKNQNRHHHLSRYKSMIIFGPDISRNMYKLLLPFETSIQLRYGKGNELYLFDIPVIYIPTISGIHVLPDLTGKWHEKAVSEPSPTALYRNRYN